MNKYTAYLKMCLMGLLLVAFVAGCAENAQENPIVANANRLTVSSTVPANGATFVPIGNKLTVTFSEAMDPATITTTTFTLQQGATAVSGTVAYTGVTAVFTPTSNLAASTVCTATITTGAKALSGNVLAANYTWSFTTGMAVDTTAPTVSSHSPC